MQQPNPENGAELQVMYVKKWRALLYYFWITKLQLKN